MKIVGHTGSVARLIFLLVVGAGTAAAQNNAILIDQGNPRGGDVGNTLFVDQTGASNSLVAGIETGQPQDILQLDPEITPLALGPVSNFDSEAPAVQFGSGNSASITLSGDGVIAGLSQLGNDNDAVMNISGLGAAGTIFQDGNGNEADLLVLSDRGRGELVQIGNDNDTELAVTGGPNASVSFTIEGNGVSTSVPASVSSFTGGQVTIIQRQLNSFVSP